jgi:adenosylhomocysteine nucleosidase
MIDSSCYRFYSGHQTSAWLIRVRRRPVKCIAVGIVISLYSALRPPYSFNPMLLITAALEEELNAGMLLCENPKKIRCRGVDIWQAVLNDREVCFLRTGVGPARSAARLDEALKAIEPSQILVVGYAGAIHPDLKLGDLVAVRKAMAFSLDKNRPGWESVRLDGAFDLVNFEALSEHAKSAGLSVHIGDALTSAHVLGNPEHKCLLYERFHASIVDMETAALARAALSNAIPLGCMRAISDAAKDTFLAPFSYDPAINIPDRAKKLFDAGLTQTYRQWKEHAAIAKESLSRFLSHYLGTTPLLPL